MSGEVLRGADGGWGLLIVGHASDRWGVADGSTNVWFEIDAGQAS